MSDERPWSRWKENIKLPDVNSALVGVHSVYVGSVADVSDVYATSIFRLERGRVTNQDAMPRILIPWCPHSAFTATGRRYGPPPPEVSAVTEHLVNQWRRIYFEDTMTLVHLPHYTCRIFGVSAEINLHQNFNREVAYHLSPA
jgi:hypothetical protein